MMLLSTGGLAACRPSLLASPRIQGLSRHKDETFPGFATCGADAPSGD
jgi:hypothetical protein